MVFARSTLLLCLLLTLPAVANQGDPTVRKAAQRGINFLASSTAAWQKQHQCYGCHVQAVTLEGLAVGKHHQYEVPSRDLAVILDGVLNSNGGARLGDGLSPNLYPRTSRTFGGANLLTFLLYAALGGGLYYLPFNLILVQGCTATGAAAALVPMFVLLFLLPGS